MDNIISFNSSKLDFFCGYVSTKCLRVCPFTSGQWERARFSSPSQSHFHDHLLDFVVKNFFHQLGQWIRTRWSFVFGWIRDSSVRHLDKKLQHSNAGLPEATSLSLCARSMTSSPLLITVLIVDRPCGTCDFSRVLSARETSHPQPPVVRSSALWVSDASSERPLRASCCAVVWCCRQVA